MNEYQIKISNGEVKLEHYHPSTVAESKEFKALAKIENPEFNILIDAVQFSLDNYYIQTLHDWGLVRWEQILGIVPQSNDSIEDRRQAVEWVLKSQLPYTYKQMIHLLTDIVGFDGFKVYLDCNNYSLKVLVSLGQKRQKEQVEQLLNRIVPMNIRLFVDLLHNRHIDLEPYTHEYLSNLTHDGIESEVIE